MKILTTLAFITLTGTLFGATNTFAGDVTSQSINVNSKVDTFYDQDLATPADTQSRGPKETPNGYCGALNMLMDLTMWDIPMSRDAAQGNAGMFHAVGVSGCL